MSTNCLLLCNFRQNLFVVCRELQAVVSEEREMGIKIMAFSRSILKEGIIKDYDKLGVSGSLLDNSIVVGYFAEELAKNAQYSFTLT